MTFIHYIVVIGFIYLCVCHLIERICRCIEHCATARAYSKFKENGVMVKLDDVAAGILKSNVKKEKVEEYVEKRVN